MPTATITTHTATTTTATIPLKTVSSLSCSTAATLRSLYPRAATAFLQRDIALTHSLLTSAFAILSPPLFSQPEDTLTAHRRKWDLLRITFETTLFASPPPAEDPEVLPAPLRANQVLSPQSLVAALHTRSLQLFTPTSSPQKASSAFLPAQILVTLGLASLKLGCPDVGRGIVEDWLTRRSQAIADDHEGYTKVLDLYCLQILPRLEEWDYASDFLQYERSCPHVREMYVPPPLLGLDYTLAALSTRESKVRTNYPSLCRRFAHEEICFILIGDTATEGAWYRSDMDRVLVVFASHSLYITLW